MPIKNNFQDRISLLAHVAERYYIDGSDQSVIAKEIGLTRSMISRMLTEARNRGIVEIRINHPIWNEHALEDQIKSRFNIPSVFVISVRKNIDSRGLTAQLGRAGASVLSQFLQEGKSIGLAWGSTVSAVVDALNITNPIPMKVVQLIGALGAQYHEYDGHAVVQRLADKLGGESYFINAPYLCQTSSIAKAFMESPGIAETIAMGRQVDMALLGIGTTDLRYSSFYLAGYATEEDILHYRESGAVGDIAGIHFDINGETLKDEILKRQITIHYEDLLDVPTRICVAGGPGKIRAIYGALQSGLVNVLVTDSTSARSLLESYRSI